MKKIALSIALVMASSSVMAETYFKLGVSQSTGNLSAVALQEAYVEDENFPAAGFIERLNETEFSSQSITLGVGQDFNEYVSGEIRYTLGTGNSTDDVDIEYGDSVDFLEVVGHEFDGNEFTHDMQIQEDNRIEGLILLKTPQFGGIQPYVMAGYGMSNLSAGGAEFDVSGLTYGAGIEFDFDNNWSLSLEYQVLPETEYKHSSETTYGESSNEEDSSSSDEQSSTGESDQSLSGNVIKSNYRYTHDASRAMLSLNYRF